MLFLQPGCKNNSLLLSERNLIPMSRKVTIIAIVLAVVIIVLTGFLTYHAPDWLVFADLG